MMTRSTVLGRCGSIALMAAIVTLAAMSPALAQGTPEQREACAPDAINLCQDTIPDVEKTTACMKAHESELSPKCRAFFSEATEAPTAGSETRAETAPPLQSYDNADGLGDYRAQVATWCREGTIDPFSCRNAKDALHMR